ncbi:MAG: hypothetical protein ACXQTG_02460 [Methanoculleaceae archaeon]
MRTPRYIRSGYSGEDETTIAALLREVRAIRAIPEEMRERQV